jgi:prepilin-type N-terminal cleavage/methylation domain-containing protein/prepilin-type processing-associated H-X9-DG protein
LRAAIRSKCKCRCRRAFSMVELVVVMAIISLLLAIGVPAVTRARAASRRAQCLNNMRNISLALTEFEGAHLRLPASGNFADVNDQIDGHHSWAVSILPWVDQMPLYSQWDCDKPVMDPVNQPLARSHVPVYVCPADISRSRDKKGGDLSYAVNGGIGYSVRRLGVPDCAIDPERRVLDLNGNGIGCPMNPDDDGDPSDRTYFKFLGMFFLENWNKGGTVRHHALGDVHDGLSQTFLMAENARTGYDPLGSSPGFATSDPFRCAFYVGNPCPTGGCIAGTVDYSLSNAGDYRINSGLTQPEGKSPVPNSFHEGGVHMSFADGHVKFLSETIDGAAYAALASPQGRLLEGTPLEQTIVGGELY